MSPIDSPSHNREVSNPSLPIDARHSLEGLQTGHSSTHTRERTALTQKEGTNRTRIALKHKDGHHTLAALTYTQAIGGSFTAHTLAEHTQVNRHLHRLTDTYTGLHAAETGWQSLFRPASPTRLGRNRQYVSYVRSTIVSTSHVQ